MENTFNYSDEWQPYKGYDKFEYDVKLASGEVIENCYPNAGRFHGLDGKRADESEVIEIRFSQSPVTDLNIEVSEAIRDGHFFTSYRKEVFPIVADIENLMLRSPISYPKPDQYRRPTPKISRNINCPCGSGKKYKKCCLKSAK